MDITPVLTLITQSTTPLGAIIISLTYLIALYMRMRHKKQCTFCKYEIVTSQMRVYRDRVAVYKTLALKAYAEDFDAAIADGSVVIPSKERHNIMTRMRETLASGFYEAEIYFRSLVYENHIPDPESADFGEYCVEKYNAHQTIVWDYYEENYNKDFFKLTLNGRREKFDTKNNQAFSDWCNMMKRLYEIAHTPKRKEGKDD